MEDLTETQRRTYDFIRLYIRENVISPTIAEIADGMGWKSSNAVHQHLVALEQKGYLSIKRGSWRGIRLPSSTYEHDRVALDTATRIMAVMRTATLNKDYWPEVRIKAAIQVEVINALKSRGAS
ncbi:repressor LexA [Pantoea ananatis]|uniref:LexA family protein n=1 Tax=Pantoea ananas TaxID=553 RepID=UPI00278AA764|nr:LexA family transcriptional regulator [Pantoea ananatis]MDQ1226506.1 repressor LexA [Pantoea ananatis]MDR6088384.1 repressor LexA [Pantoea ananatis]